MLITVLSTGLLTSAAVMVTMHRSIGIRKMVKHATKIDICFSLLLVWSFAGTVTGILTAVIAGLAMALTLSFLAKLINYTDKLVAMKTDIVGHTKSNNDGVQQARKFMANQPRSGRKPFAIKL